jgi:hypothetical protein
LDFKWTSKSKNRDKRGRLGQELSLLGQTMSVRGWWKTKLDPWVLLGSWEGLRQVMDTLFE